MISFLVAMDRNRVIGKDNDLPWKLPADLAYFKKLTTGHTVVMGRKTYESIGRPLPNRQNVILTRDKQYTAENCVVIHSVEEALELMNKKEDKYFIIGGSDLFEQFLPYVDRMYITFIDETFEGDTFFPEVDMSNWKLVLKQKGKKDEKNRYEHSFLVYDRLKR
ncbi:dihydrofolate reductase [Pueribacillus sp. YX66]|uniref:dihydrofolate reductase n=1 Tax=Pueribacillus sp. YX66 TaxID=3229242 RepID=UPI00358D16E8